MHAATWWAVVVQQRDHTASGGLGNAATIPVGKRSLCPWRVRVHGINSLNRAVYKQPKQGWLKVALWLTMTGFATSVPFFLTDAVKSWKCPDFILAKPVSFIRRDARDIQKNSGSVKGSQMCWERCILKPVPQAGFNSITFQKWTASQKIPFLIWQAARVRLLLPAEDAGVN